MYVIRFMYMQELKQEMYTKRVTKNYDTLQGRGNKSKHFWIS